MTSSFLENERARIFDGEDRDLYLHVGYFISWNNMVEHKITLLMALIMGEEDLSAFDLITRNLNGQTKVGRLKRLCELKKREIEQPLLDRLDHYTTKIYPLRNKLAHRSTARDEKVPRFYLVTLDRLPWKALGVAVPMGMKVQAPDHIDAITVFEYGLWLHSFSEDLTEVIDCAIKREPLGIKTPRSPLPKAPLAATPKP
jgi:hypothetical protein